MKWINLFSLIFIMSTASVKALDVNEFINLKVSKIHSQFNFSRFNQYSSENIEMGGSYNFYQNFILEFNVLLDHGEVAYRPKQSLSLSNEFKLIDNLDLYYQISFKRYHVSYIYAFNTTSLFYLKNNNILTAGLSYSHLDSNKSSDDTNNVFVTAKYIHTINRWEPFLGVGYGKESEFLNDQRITYHLTTIILGVNYKTNKFSIFSDLNLEHRTNSSIKILNLGVSYFYD